MVTALDSKSSGLVQALTWVYLLARYSVPPFHTDVKEGTDKLKGPCSGLESQGEKKHCYSLPRKAEISSGSFSPYTSEPKIVSTKPLREHCRVYSNGLL